MDATNVSNKAEEKAPAHQMNLSSGNPIIASTATVQDPMDLAAVLALGLKPF